VNSAIRGAENVQVRGKMIALNAKNIIFFLALHAKLHAQGILVPVIIAV